MPSAMARLRAPLLFMRKRLDSSRCTLPARDMMRPHAVGTVLLELPVVTRDQGVLDPLVAVARDELLRHLELRRVVEPVEKVELDRARQGRFVLEHEEPDGPVAKRLGRAAHRHPLRRLKVVAQPTVRVRIPELGRVQQPRPPLQPHHWRRGEVGQGRGGRLGHGRRRRCRGLVHGLGSRVRLSLRLLGVLGVFGLLARGRPGVLGVQGDVGQRPPVVRLVAAPAVACRKPLIVVDRPEVGRKLAHNVVDGVTLLVAIHRVRHVELSAQPGHIEVLEGTAATVLEDAQRNLHRDVLDRAEVRVLLGHHALEEHRDAPLHERVERALPREHVAPWAEGEGGPLVGLLGELGHAVHRVLRVLAVHLVARHRGCLVTVVDVRHQLARVFVCGPFALVHQELPQRRPADRLAVLGVDEDGSDKGRKGGAIRQAWDRGRQVWGEKGHRHARGLWVVLAPNPGLAQDGLCRVPVPRAGVGRYLSR
eukprot:scaffold40810_cov64-Phaeocystis_antarctica.AAC.2